MRMLRRLTVAMAVSATIVVPSTTAGATSGKWVPIGPWRGPANVVAAAPYGGTMLADGPAGVFRSVDSGTTWARVHQLDGSVLDDRFSAFAFSPNDPSLAYASGQQGLWESTDGGAGWSLVSEGLTAGGSQSLVVDAFVPGRLFLATYCDVYRSTDAGRTWRKVLDLDGSDQPDCIGPSFVVAVPGNRGALLVGWENGLRRSDDAGWTWSGTGTIDDYVGTIAFDPADPETMYSGNDDGIEKSVDGGAHWASVLESPVGISELAIDPATSAIVAGTYGSKRDGSVLVSSDDGATWPRSDRGIPPQNIGSVAAADGGTVAIPTQQGVAVSTNDGGKWIFHRLGRDPVGVVDVDVSTHTIFAASYFGGVYRDDGDGWQLIHAGRSEDFFYRIEVAPSDPDVVYALADQAGLERSDDGGGHWRPLRPVNTESGPWWIAVDPVDPMTVYLSGYGVSKSVDGGVHWHGANQGLRGFARYQNHVVIDPHRHQRLYTPSSHGVYRSSDGGASWHRASAGLPRGDFPSGGWIFDVAVDPTKPAVLYAASDHMYRSTDGAATWHKLPGSPTALQIAIDRADPALLWCIGYDSVGNLTVLRSIDAGKSWEAVPGGPTAHELADIAVRRDGEVFAATLDGGVYRFA